MLIDSGVASIIVNGKIAYSLTFEGGFNKGSTQQDLPL